MTTRGFIWTLIKAGLVAPAHHQGDRGGHAPVRAVRSADERTVAHTGTGDLLATFRGHAAGRGSRGGAGAMGASACRSRSAQSPRRPQV